MLDFRNRSKLRFKNEMERLLKDLYVSCLDRAEKILQPDKSSDNWKQFRFGILNLGNDKIRLLYDKLDDYTIEFRPAIFSVKYNVDVPSSKLAEFTFEIVDNIPSFRVICSNKTLLNTIYDALQCGTINDNNYVVNGMYNIFHKVIPFFDTNECFKGKTLERYNTWKEKVYILEKDSNA